MKYTSEYLISYLQNKAVELGRTPTVYDTDRPNYRVFYSRFGSWINALKIAGLYEGKEYVKYDNEMIKDELKSKAKELGRPPFAYEFETYFVSQCHKHFGSYKNALIEAGVKQAKKVYKKEELIGKIKSLYKELGRLPKRTDLENTECIACQKLFGSWQNALIEAGLKQDYKTRKAYYQSLRGELIERLKCKYKELGRTPRAMEFDREEYKMYLKCFGSWKQALKESNIEDDWYERRWGKKQGS